MRQIERINLLAWCRKNHIDSAYIDSTLTYRENKMNLAGMVEAHLDYNSAQDRKIEFLEKCLAKEQRRSAYWKYKYTVQVTKKSIRGDTNGSKNASD